MVTTRSQTRNQDFYNDESIRGAIKTALECLEKHKYQLREKTMKRQMKKTGNQALIDNGLVRRSERIRNRNNM